MASGAVVPTLVARVVDRMAEESVVFGWLGPGASTYSGLLPFSIVQVLMTALDNLLLLLLLCYYMTMLLIVELQLLLMRLLFASLLTRV